MTLFMATVCDCGYTPFCTRSQPPRHSVSSVAAQSGWYIFKEIIIFRVLNHSFTLQSAINGCEETLLLPVIYMSAQLLACLCGCGRWNLFSILFCSVLLSVSRSHPVELLILSATKSPLSPFIHCLVVVHPVKKTMSNSGRGRLLRLIGLVFQSIKHPRPNSVAHEQHRIII